MKTIKSYLAFAPTLYKILVLGLIPLLILALTTTTFLFQGFPVGIFIPSIYMIIVCFADVWLLGGIHSKEFRGLEFVQSSQKGRAYMKRVLFCDNLVKYVYLSVMMLLALHFSVMADPTANAHYLYYMGVFCAIVVGGTASITLTVTRFFDNMAASWFFSYLIGFASMFIIYLVDIAYQKPVIGLLAAIVYAVFGTWLNMHIGVKKVEEKYYDK